MRYLYQTSSSRLRYIFRKGKNEFKKKERDGFIETVLQNTTITITTKGTNKNRVVAHMNSMTL